MSDDTGIGNIEKTEYMPFGSMRDHSGTSITNYKFTDQELDPETGLYNYKARLYDPNIGRFITPDSIIPDPYDPQSLNRYSYCRNNPLIYVDPSGHEGNIGDYGGPADPSAYGYGGDAYGDIGDLFGERSRNK
ncbi:MAG: RHS repeat-associated core domain-containing protein [Candidatus Atribacteria bacterium]|nr:RHS repeat-associated core domain-containing protein [Candidatus Atribacteria bacterium]